jgi:hypothetical protein
MKECRNNERKIERKTGRNIDGKNKKRAKYKEKNKNKEKI